MWCVLARLIKSYCLYPGAVAFTTLHQHDRTDFHVRGKTSGVRSSVDVSVDPQLSSNLCPSCTVRITLSVQESFLYGRVLAVLSLGRVNDYYVDAYR